MMKSMAMTSLLKMTLKTVLLMKTLTLKLQLMKRQMQGEFVVAQVLFWLVHWRLTTTQYLKIMTWWMRNQGKISLQSIMKNTSITSQVITATSPVGTSLEAQGVWQHKEIMDCAWVLVIMTGSRYLFMNWVIEDCCSILRNWWDILMIRYYIYICWATQWNGI